MRRPTASTPLGDDGQPSAPEGSRPAAAVAVLAGLSLLLVAAAVVLALRSRDDAPPAYPPGSPEARLAAYVAAMQAGDVATAYPMLSDAYRATVSEARFGDQFGHAFPADSQRIVVRESRVEGDRAFLTVDVTTLYGTGLFGSSESTRLVRVTLLREGGEWRFERPPPL